MVHSRALRSVVAGRASGGGGKFHRSLCLTSLDISSVTFDRTTKSEAGFPVTVASAICPRTEFPSARLNFLFFNKPNVFDFIFVSYYGRYNDLD